MSEQRTARFRAAVSRTRDATAMTLRRRDTRVVFGSVTVVYLAVYLWVLGHLAPGLGGYGVNVIADPFAAFLRPELGQFSFTPVARVRVGPVTYLFSFNTVIGFGVAALVGLNLALTYLVWTQPKACGVGQSTGLLASLPALLSGTACCGPVVLLVLGIQASGLLVFAFQYLLPFSVIALIGSLFLVARQIRLQAIP